MTAQREPMLVSAEHFWSWTTTSIRRAQDGYISSKETHYSFFWARNAIYHSLKLLGIEPGSGVLVPSYVCRAAIDPLVAYGMDVDFYAIQRDCKLDVDDVTSRVTPRTRAILLVHYFGFPQEIRRIRDFCNKRQIVLIEDCAHVLSGDIDGQSLGTFGDAAVFSWRKFLPVFDGAELVINQPGRAAKLELAKETPLFTLKVALYLLDQSMRHSRGFAFRAAYSGLQSLENTLRRCANTYIDKSTALRIENTSAEFDKGNINLPMSRVSRWIKRHSNIRSIVAKRRRNYQILQSELQSSKITPLFPDLPLSVCPWVFPVFFNGTPGAHRVLRRRGIPANAWDDVRHPSIRRGAHADADFLYENLVFLPIHQSLLDKDVMKMTSVARSL